MSTPRPHLLRNTVLLSLFLLTCNAAASFFSLSSSSYYITAPQYFLPGQNTTLAVHWFGDQSQEIIVSAGIAVGNDFVVNASKLFSNDSVGLLTIPALPENISDNCILVVNGCANKTLLFNHQTNIFKMPERAAILIQTDKDNYRPGETVHIRVISVNQNLTPSNLDMDLGIQDPFGRFVQRWSGLKSELGVLSVQFLLTSNPLLGDWNVLTGSRVSSNAITFKVTDNVPPKCYVTLDVPPVYLGSKMMNLTGTVTAKCVSNIPVEGNLTITVSSGERADIYVKKTYQISGNVAFSFSYSEIERVMSMGHVNVTASVTDQVKGAIIETSSYVINAASEYEINFIDQRPVFKLGDNFTAKIQIQRIDRKALTEEERKHNVSVIFTQHFSSSEEISEQHHVIPKTGIITVHFPITSMVRWINVMVKYQNTTKDMNNDDVHTTNPFVEIRIMDSTLKVGVPFNVQVDVRQAIQEIFYTVSSKGFTVAAGKNRTTFSLMPENSWAPLAELTVYLINFNGIMTISKTLEIKGILNNKVALSWSKSAAKPLEDISLVVSVKDLPSLVGIRIAEKSSTLTERKNDITLSRIYQELYPNNMGSSLLRFTDGYIFTTYKYIPRTIEGSMMPIKQGEPVFDEIWIWQMTNMSSSLKSSLTVQVPDRNTTWVATAFVISQGLGLGVADEPVEITIFKPFVVSMNLPYSVTRGEQFILEVTAANSFQEKLQILITLGGSDAFDITVPSNSNSTATVVGQQSVIVPSGDKATALFPIKPKTLGNITFTVTATSDRASDVKTQSVLVKAEGRQYIHTQTELFNLFSNGNAVQYISRNFSFNFPSDVIKGSETAFITVIGDLLGPSINGLDSLIEMPCGCGEQNMINFAPNIYVLQYLKASGQIKEDIRKRALNFMEQGYQKELTYMRADGSFSAFGESDASGSTWLSAFVFRCFLQARPYIYINPVVLNNVANWLVQYQDQNTGQFSEPGCVIHRELQGGLNGPVTLTAYIVTSLLEDESYRQIYATSIGNAIQYIERKYDEGISSHYTLSVVTYALSLSKSSKARAALDQLNSMANTTEETRFWFSPSETSNSYWQPRSTDIETAAYALLSYCEQNRIAESKPVMKWLSQQRSHLGGYGSTQDTIVALQALSKFTMLTTSEDTSLNVSLTWPHANIPKRFQINKANVLTLQRQQITVSQPISINVTVTGRGEAIVQLNVMYNTKTLSRRRRSTSVTEAFKLDVSVKDNTNNTDRLTVDICTRYQGIGNETGMAILDVGFLSGFTLNTEDLIKPQTLKLVEVKDDKAYLYFDSVTKDKLCLSLPMVRFAKVAGSQDAVVKVYDYYNPEMTATRTYNSLTMRQISSCDFCGYNCSLCKSNVPLKVKPPNSSASIPTFYMLLLCMVFLCHFL